MYIRIPTTTTESQALIVMVHYYRYMCPRRYHILDPLTEASSGPKSIKILWYYALGSYCKKIKRMVSVETLLSYLECKIPFIVHTDVSDKHLGAIIIHNNKPIALFSRSLINPQRNYTATKK